MNRIYQLFRQAYTRGHFATLSGTATREEFWYFAFCQTLIGWILGFILTVFSWFGALSMFLDNDGVPFSLIVVGILALIYVVFFLVSLIPTISLTVRRYHDAGLSGYVFGAILLGMLICAVVGIYEVASAISMGMYAPMMNETGFGTAVVFMLLSYLAFIAHMIILALPSKPAEENPLVPSTPEAA